MGLLTEHLQNLQTRRNAGGAGEEIERAVRMLAEKVIREQELHGERIGLSLVDGRREERVSAKVGKREAAVEHGMAQLVSAGETLLRFGNLRIDMDKSDALVRRIASPGAAEVTEEHVNAESIGDFKGVGSVKTADQ